MDRVTAVMDSSGGMAKYMTNEVREIARVTVFTANEVSEGLMQLGMAGLKTKDAMAALEPFTAIGFHWYAGHGQHC